MILNIGDMMKKEKTKMGQVIELVLRGPDGKVKSHKRVSNQKGKRLEENLA